MNKYAKLGKNVLLMTIGNFSSRFLSVIFLPLYTSILTTEEYGITDMVVTTVTLLFPVFTLMICEAMMRYALDKGADHSKIYMSGMVIWGCGFILLALLSPLINFIPTLNGYSFFVLLYYFSYSLYFNLSYFSRGIEKITSYTLGGIVQTFLTVSLNIIMLFWLKLGINGYLLSYIIANFIAALFLIFSTKIYKYKFSSFDLNSAKEMLMFSLPMIPNQLSWWVSKSSSKYILTFFHGASVNGLFSVAHKIPSILNSIMGIFSSAWRISAVDALDSDDTKRFYSTIYNNYVSLLTMSTSFLILVNKIIASLLYSKSFYAANVFVPLLLLSSMFNGLGDHLGSIYISYKKTKPIFITTMISAVINVVLGVALIPKYGTMGACIATLMGYLSIWLIRLIDSRKMIKLNYKHFRDITTFILLVLQVVIEFISFNNFWVFSAVIFLAVVFLQREALLIVKNFVVSFFKKIAHKN